MNIKTLALAASLLLFPLAASATDWTVYNDNNNTCESALHMAEKAQAPNFITPFALREYLKEHPSANYRGYAIHHASKGILVTITAFNDTTVFYFSSRSACEQTAKNEADNPRRNLNELR